MTRLNELLKPHLIEIKNLVSCPYDIYQTVYIETIHRLAVFCQAMPDAFLAQQLQISIATLKLRRGIFFPKDADIEVIAAEEPQWTYALFSAAMLRNMDQISSYQNAKNKDDFIMEIAKRIIPPKAMDWLTQNSFLYTLWQQAILHQHNDISAVIEKSMFLLGKKAPTPTSNAIHKNTCKDVFMSWLIKKVDEKAETIFQMQKGLFVSDKMVQHFITEQKNITDKILIQQLTQSNVLVVNGQNISHSLSPKKFEDRRVIHGMILNNEHIPEALQSVPLNDYYQENIIL